MVAKSVNGLGTNAGTKNIEEKMADKNWEVEIAHIQGEIKLVNEKLDTLENNHLKHIQQQIDKLSYVLWTVGLLVFTQLVYALRTLLF